MKLADAPTPLGIGSTCHSVIGTLEYSTADAKTVGRALESVSGPTNPTEHNAEPFVCAIAALNRSAVEFSILHLALLIRRRSSS